MVLVVCDSTPLIYLTRLERFDLLRELYQRVLVPSAVWRELAVDGAERPEGQNVIKAAAAEWLQVAAPQTEIPLVLQDEELDSGEAEAIQLAIERNAMLVIDEAHGREVARKCGVKITGTVGILVRARHENLIPSVRAELDHLRSATTFRLSDAIYYDALRAVGELE